MEEAPIYLTLPITTKSTITKSTANRAYHEELSLSPHEECRSHIDEFAVGQYNQCSIVSN
jgi:hypothetical protein